MNLFSGENCYSIKYAVFRRSSLSVSCKWLLQLIWRLEDESLELLDCSLSKKEVTLLVIEDSVLEHLFPACWFSYSAGGTTQYSWGFDDFASVTQVWTVVCQMVFLYFQVRSTCHHLIPLWFCMFSGRTRLGLSSLVFIANANAPSRNIISMPRFVLNCLSKHFSWVYFPLMFLLLALLVLR